MILVDTSVWVAHLRTPDARLGALLHDGQVLTHPFVIAELACGNLRRREELLSYLGRLASAPLASNEEARGLVESRKLMGRGLGWIDVHLLASCLLAATELWSLDVRLSRAAGSLGVRAG